MYIYRDRTTLGCSAALQDDPQLKGLISKRLQDLSDYKDYDLADLIHILLIEPSDALTDVDAELGFSLLDLPWDVVECHRGWYEITVIVSDDGFGWAIYVPNHPAVDQALLSLCLNRSRESMP